MSTSVVRTELREDGLLGVMYTPAEPGSRPAVLLLDGSEGTVPERAAAMLAQEGFAALAVAYFGTDPLPPRLEEVPLEYFSRALDRLRPHATGISVLGRSRGGELALLLGATYPAIGAVVAYVPSSVVWQAPPSGMFAQARSSWSLGGAPVPFVPSTGPTPADGQVFRDFVSGRPIAFRPYFEKAMAQEDAVERAAIAVERVDGPVMVLSAGDDQLWPSPDFAHRISERLGGRCLHLHYERAGHRLGVPGTLRPPVAGPLVLGGGAEEDARASEDAWPQVVEFLKKAG